MNRKGFTLIELVAVLAILSIIMTIAIPSISSSLERSKVKQKEQKIKVIESMAEIYISDNRGRVSTTVPCRITTEQLSTATLLKTDDLKDPTIQDGIISGCVLYNKPAGTFTFDNSNCTATLCVE